jgi:hypothetical protein
MGTDFSALVQMEYFVSEGAGEGDGCSHREENLAGGRKMEKQVGNWPQDRFEILSFVRSYIGILLLL